MSLSFRTKNALTISEGRVPKEFYQNKAGRWIDTSVIESVQSVATVRARTKYTFATYAVDDEDNVTDETIEKALPKDGLFDEESVFAFLAEMILLQSKGETGFLSTANENLFYLLSYVLCVYWRPRGAGEAGWSVYAAPRTKDKRYVGTRIFSLSQ